MADEGKNAKQLIELRERLNASYEQELNSINKIFNRTESRMLQEERLANNQRTINELKSRSVELDDDDLEKLVELENEQRKLIVQAEKRNRLKKAGADIGREIVTQLKTGWHYLQEQDKIIKTTNLNLGMSNAKAASMRDAFEKSAGYVTRIGGSIADIQDIMQGFAEETGRARALSSQMVEDIATIGKGTGLGIQEATRLGAQFELMGLDVRATMNYVQGVVDTTERMGVNTTKVLKNVNDNFKRLNTYTFQQGVKGFAQMASYAEKFRIDITQALNAADVSRTLEGAIDLTAQLQVMGGEFAKTDPFEMLFLSRNDPAKFTEKIADMTKGVVSFRKMADGSFEKFISPADRDRIANVAKSMGMEASALTEIAERQAEIQRMRKQMRGIGLSKEQKEAIEGAALFDSASGKFQVKLADTMVNLRDLTKEQASSFLSQQVMLEERAKQAQTFNDVFNATIESLKSSLLPLLQTINKVLVPVAKLSTSITQWASEGNTWLRAGSALMGAALAWKSVGMITGLAGTAGRNVTGRIGTRYAASSIGRSSVGSLFTKSAGATAGRGGTAIAKGGGGGMKGFGAGAGLGVAMAGAGAGIMLAAKGISQLSDSMSKLTPEQAENLAKIVKSLSWFIVGAAAAAVGVAALGGTATAAAPGLLAFGAAVLMAGAGIGLATSGISKMGEGLAELNKSGDGAGKQLLGVAAGVGAITLAMGTGGIVGMFAFNKGIKSIASHSDGIEKVGTAFENIKAVLSGSKDDFMAVEKAVNSISSAKVRGGGIFSELANLLNKPLKVEFADNGRVALTNDITLNIDSQRFMNKVYDVNVAVQKHESLKHGKGS